MAVLSGGKPPLAGFLGRIFGNSKRFLKFQSTIWILTYLSYMMYHMTRKTLSVVKSTWNPKVTFDVFGEPQNLNAGWPPFNQGAPGTSGDKLGVHLEGQTIMGGLDTAFLFAYSVGLFISGHLAEHSNLRYYLTGGMIGSAVMCAMLGYAYFFDIHSLGYFIVVQMSAGFYQASGWPSVVGIMGNWYPKGRRAFVMGIWNSNLNVGNILGAVVPAAVLALNWGWSFLISATLMMLVAVCVFLMVPVYPHDADLQDLADPNQEQSAETAALLLTKHSSSSYFGTSPAATDAITPSASTNLTATTGETITVWKALFIPGVAAFSIALFFTKLISYTFLDWLPYYVKNTPIDGQTLGAADAAYFSTLFDVGGIFGGIAAGYFADRWGAPALVCIAFLYTSVIALFLYREEGPESKGASVALLLFAGAMVNGPYALITTAVSADLGTHKSLKGNAKAMSVVAGLIDGTGSLGATLGPFIAGTLPSWTYLFYILMASAFTAALCLTRLVIKEVKALRLTGRGEYEYLSEVEA